MKPSVIISTLAMFGLVCFITNFAFADAPDSSKIPLNQDHEGELGGTIGHIGWDPLGHGIDGYKSENTIELKAGKGVKLVANVTGSGRKVGLILIDETGVQLGASKFDVKDATLNVGEVSYSGIYTVQVVSDRIGTYSVCAFADEDETEASIQAKIDALTAELAVQQQKLKDLKEKEKENAK